MALKFLNDGYFAGKVGIGTESPSRNLQVKGTANTAIAITSSTSSLAQLALGDTDDDNYAQIILDNSTNKLQIQNGGGGIISNRGITLDSSENVGIGTDDPIELLHLYGGVGNPARIRLQADDGQDDVLTFHQSTTQKGAIGYDDSDDVVSLTYGGLSGTTGIKINSSGNVGIGTPSPTAKLQVAGATTYNSDSAQALRVCDATDVSKGIHIGFDTTLDAGIIQAADFGVSYRNLLLNPNANNVGIGEISPNAKLHVNAGTENTVALFESTDARSRIVLKDNSGEGQLSAIGDNITFATSSSATERMRITSAGGISFGSTGTAYGTSGQILKSNGNASPTWIDGSAIPGVPAGSGTLNTVAMWTPDGDTLGNSNITQSTSFANDIIIPQYVRHTSDTNTYFGFGLNDTVNFGTAGSERMRITSGGNVGIGTTSPLSKLTIGANAITTKKPTVIIADGVAGGSLVIRGLSPILSFDRTGANPENKILMDGAGLEFKTGSLDAEGDVDFKIKLDGKLQAPAYTQGFLQSDANGNIEISGGGTLPGGPYLPLAGGTMTGVTQFNDHTQHGDQVQARWGASNDFTIEHNATDSSITNITGDLYITNKADDKDIVFRSDDGSGGFTTYFKLDGSAVNVRIDKPFLFTDNVKAEFGSSQDLQIYHDGSNSYIKDTGTGDLIINTNLLAIQNAGATESMAKFFEGGTVALYYDDSLKFATTSTGVEVAGDINIDSALLSNQENTDVDTGTETVANVAIATYTAAFFDFVIKKTTNVRSGTVYACHDGTNVEFTETSTQDLGDTSDVTLSVDISGGNMRLRATTTSDDWSIKSLIRAI